MLKSCWYVVNWLCDSVSNMSTHMHWFWLFSWTVKWNVTQRVILANGNSLWPVICSEYCDVIYYITTWLHLLHHSIITSLRISYGCVIVSYMWDRSFQWRFSTYRPVARKPEVGAQMCWHTSGRGPPAVHFGSPVRFGDASYKNLELGHFS